jgi:ABC-2 type transport system permease protein
VKVAIWYAIMSFQIERLQYSIIENTIRYMVLTSSLSLLYQSFDRGNISGKIISGTIERDLLYPVSVIGLQFSSGFGLICIDFFRTSLLTLIILSLLYSLSWNFNILSFIGLILLLIEGLIIQYLFITIIDLLSFWTTETNTIQRMWDATYKFLGGFLIPSWIFPGEIETILYYLPFKYIVSIPVSCFIFQYNLQQIISSFIGALLWIFLLLLITRIIWNLGIRKLKINGG